MTTKPDKLQTLLDVVAEADKKDLVLAHNARIQTMQAYQTKPGKDTRADMAAAREEYDDTIARLTAVYFPQDTPAAEGERFKNRKQALNWLQAQGYKVSTGKFYQDCDAGFPNIHKDGSLSRYQTMQYGQQLDIERRGAGPVDPGNGREADEARKIKADADKSEMQAEDMRREQDKKWLHQESAWEALAALVGVLRDSLRHQFHVGQTHIIHLAGGDPVRAPEVYEACEELIGRAYNEVLASGRIEGIFELEDETEDTP